MHHVRGKKYGVQDRYEIHSQSMLCKLLLLKPSIILHFSRFTCKENALVILMLHDAEPPTTPLHPRPRHSLDAETNAGHLLRAHVFAKLLEAAE